MIINASSGLTELGDGAHLWVGSLNHSLEEANLSAFQRAYLLAMVAAAAIATAENLIKTYGLDGALGEVLGGLG